MTVNGISVKDAATMLNVSGQAVWYWKTNKRRPSYELMNRITNWTGGKVTANDFQLATNSSVSTATDRNKQNG